MAQATMSRHKKKARLITLPSCLNMLMEFISIRIYKFIKQQWNNNKQIKCQIKISNKRTTFFHFLKNELKSFKHT